jgi:HAD superfamily, subfamily IIIB (Acid phosphatase)
MTCIEAFMRLQRELSKRMPARKARGLKEIRSVLLCLFCCAVAVFPYLHGQSAAEPAAQSLPRNLGDLKQQLTDYEHSGRYKRDVAAVLSSAEGYVLRRAPLVRKPAIVLDIDETSLSNWPQIQANDYGRIANGPCNLPAGPCGSTSWVASAQAEAIVPTLALFRAAKAKGVSIFFITGRNETAREATEGNLRKVGYDGWTALVMRPAGTSTPSAADYKAPERAKIAAQGFTIIANVGDQPSDLAGGNAERVYLVPNPFYRIP